MFRKETFHNHENADPFMTRWTLLNLFGFALYVHKFFGSDARAPHDHPRRFLTIGLRGRYFEHRFDSRGNPEGVFEFRSPWVRTFEATHTHWQEMKPGEACWTLALAFPKTREWGFWWAATWWPWREYIAMHFGQSDRSSGPPQGREAAKR